MSEYIQSKTHKRIPLAAIQKLGYLNAGILRKGQHDRDGKQSYLLLSGSEGLRHSYTGEDGKTYQQNLLELASLYPEYATYISFLTQQRLYTSIPVFSYEIG